MKKFKELKSQLAEAQINEIKAPFGKIVSKAEWDKELMKHKKAALGSKAKPGLPGGTLQGPKGFVLAKDSKIQKIKGDELESNGQEWLVHQYHSHKSYGLKLLATFRNTSSAFTYYIIK